jgi:hypothetical protein
VTLMNFRSQPPTIHRGGNMFRNLRSRALSSAAALAMTAGMLAATAAPANAADVIAISNFETDLCAEPEGVGNGALVVQRPCTEGNRAQLWSRISVGSAYYIMVNNDQPSMCMDVRDRVNPIQIWTCTNSTTMHWSFQRVFPPFDNIKSRVGGKCLDTFGSGLVINNCVTGDSSQVWKIR